MPDHRSLLTRISLRTRIIGLVTSLVIAITLLLSWVASREAALQLEENIGYRSADTAYQMVDKLSRSMDARIKEVRLLLGIHHHPWVHRCAGPTHGRTTSQPRIPTRVLTEHDAVGDVHIRVRQYVLVVGRNALV